MMRTISRTFPSVFLMLACADIRLKVIKTMCMGSCTLEWKTKGFAGVEEQ